MNGSKLSSNLIKLDRENLPKVFIFGNTGFHINLSDGTWEWHFTPEVQNNPKEVFEENRNRYIRMFIIGFGEFLRWQSEEDSEKVEYLESRTNEGMKDFLMSLLGKDVLNITRVGPKYVVGIKVNEILKSESILKIIKTFENSVLNNPIHVYE